MRISFALLVVFFLFSSCSNMKLGDSSPADDKPSHSLSKNQMQKRSSSVEDVSYKLFLDLSEKKESYTGRVEIIYTQKNNDDLRVDFFKGKITELMVNGKLVSQIKHNGFFLTIDRSHLRSGRSKIEIKFTQDYSKTGEGFYRFVDPKDNKIYVYTDFEPYNANYLFPCFDQPNLKATYELEVLAPANWQVITSNYENEVKNVDSKKLWSFPISQKFSTYIFNVSAGPYKKWETNYKGIRKNVPLRLYARESLAKYVEHKEWFDLTKKGMSFFGDYFGVDYPFSKYDQMLVPDFNWGGMENVGAVTYSERNIYKSAPTKSQRERRANVIMHELAHMWFGNYVTMDWWNGLWLNESFATIMANIALYKTTEFKDVWETFFNRTKGWAYWQDELVTTHPIEVPVNDTDTAFTNFDGITYGKGASVLKQLIYYLGDDFQRGIQHYFKTHGYQNTKLSDFFNSLEYASNKDLSSWSKEWLYTPEVNTISTNYNCSNGMLTDFNIKQSAKKDFPFLRTHKTLVGLYNRKQGKLVKYHDFAMTYSGAETKIAAHGIACPDLVYPNIEDHDYVKVALDLKSLQTAQTSIDDLSEDMTRSMVWSSLWDMVREGKWSLDAYTKLALSSLKVETNRNIKKTLMQNIYKNALFYFSYGKNKEEFLEITKSLESFAWDKLNSAKSGSDDQKEWFQTWTHSVRSIEGLKNLQDILAKKLSFNGLEIDQDKRWDVIEVINREGLKIGADLIAKELARDNSSRSQNSALAARVAFPNLENKKQWFNELVSPDSKMKLAEHEIIMENLFVIGQLDFKPEFSELWKKEILKLTKVKENHFLDSFARYLSPNLCSDESYKALAIFIKNNDELPIAVTKSLKVQNQENMRCGLIVKNL